jgi:hypothetical protein
LVCLDGLVVMGRAEHGRYVTAQNGPGSHACVLARESVAVTGDNPPWPTVWVEDDGKRIDTPTTRWWGVDTWP